MTTIIIQKGKEKNDHNTITYIISTKNNKENNNEHSPIEVEAQNKERVAERDCSGRYRRVKGICTLFWVHHHAPSRALTYLSILYSVPIH